MANDKLEDFILNNRNDLDTATPPSGMWGRIEDELSDDDDTPDDLNTFVATHRDAFDNATPPPRLEAGIFAELSKLDNVGATPAAPLTVTHSRRRWLSTLSIAASALILVVAAFLIGSNQGYRTAEADQIVAELEKINPEFVEAEQFYRTEIASQFNKVKQVSNDPQLLADLEEIDRATAQIRADLLEVPASQRPALVEDLISIYRTKLGILLRIQRQLSPSGTPAPQTKDNEI